MLLVGTFASAVLVLLAARVYLRDLRGSALLLAFRLTAVLLLFAILSGLGIRHRWTRPGSVVAVLTDVSRSMVAVGADSQAARSVGRVALPAGVRPLYFAFAETTVVEADAGVLSGDRTLLGRALSTVAEYRIGAIVLLSDGRDNGTADAEAIAVSSGIPIYAVGCGHSATTNLALRRMRIPAEAYLGDTVRVVIEATYDGDGAATAVVELEGQRQLVRFEEAGAQEVEFGLLPRRTGFVSLIAVTDSVPGEITAADNSLQGLLHVRPGLQRVHYLSDAPGPASRFVVRALRRIRRLLLERDLTAASRVRSSDEVRVYVADQLQRDSDWERLTAEVRKGAGVMLLGTTPFGGKSSAAGLLPGGAVDIPGSSGVTRPVPIPVLPEAWQSIDYSGLPPLRPTVGAAIPESLDAWLQDGTSGALLAGARHLGAGRVVFLGGPVWHWGFLPASTLSGPTALIAIFEGAIDFLTASAEERIRLVPDRPSYMAGDRVCLRLRSVGVDGLPLPIDEVKIAVDGEPWPLPLIQTGDGDLEVVVVGLGPGVHEVTANAAGGSAHATFSISERSHEDVALGLDDACLRRLATVTGGGYVKSESLFALGLDVKLIPTRCHFEFVPRRVLWVYFLFAALAVAEWALRRRRGLP